MEEKENSLRLRFFFHLLLESFCAGRQAHISGDNRNDWEHLQGRLFILSRLTPSSPRHRRLSRRVLFPCNSEWFLWSRTSSVTNEMQPRQNISWTRTCGLKKKKKRKKCQSQSSFYKSGARSQWEHWGESKWCLWWSMFKLWLCRLLFIRFPTVKRRCTSCCAVHLISY